MRNPPALSNDIRDFLDALESVLARMSLEFKSYDTTSPIYFWIRHIARKKVVAASRQIKELRYGNIRDYAELHKRSIARIAKSTEWVWVDNISYTNFILGLIDPIKYSVNECSYIPDHLSRKIYVPSELTIFHVSNKIFDANWLYPKKILE